MEKEFVPYKIAEKFKEKGFDAPCFGFYNEKCLDNDNANCSGKFVNMCGWSIGRTNTNDLSSLDFVVIAPLYQQAVDWLRERNIRIFEKEYGWEVISHLKNVDHFKTLDDAIEYAIDQYF